MAPQLCWIGLGNMGRGMAKNLVEKGSLTSPLILYNRTTSRAEALHSKVSNTTVAHTLEEAVSPADIIFICLGDDPAVQSTISRITSSKASIKDKLIVDCSTVHPDTTTSISKTVTESGAHFVGKFIP